ncbi:MAG: hypothetical protein PVSMB4_11700 [Ktedonobacterales bacterium]
MYVVTGAASGMGRVAARALMVGRATVALVPRDAARADATATQIWQQTGNARMGYLLAGHCPCACPRPPGLSPTAGPHTGVDGPRARRFAGAVE